MTKPPSPYDSLVIPYTEDEIRQAEEQTEEYSLAEIIAEFKKQGPEDCDACKLLLPRQSEGPHG